MLTFEKIQNVFAPHLDEMEIEVVKAKHGYILLSWFESCQRYDESIEWCTTLDDLKDRLLGIYEHMLAFRRTKGKREIEEHDLAEVAPEVQRLAGTL